MLGYARHAWADRRAGNKLNLPWTNTSPPEAVRDERLCERAALAVVDGALPPGVGARATVIRAGGLYFVLGPGDNTAGEYLVVEVLDASFRRVVGIAN